MNNKIIICNGINRSGSTWSYLIAKELLSNQKFVDLGYLEGEELAKIDNHTNGEPILLKTHYYDDKLLKYQNLKLIYTHRDMRGIYVSLMKKNEVGFERVHSYEFLERAVDDYSSWTEVGDILKVSYDGIVSKTTEEVLNIAHYLEINIAREEAEKIAADYSIENNKERIRESRKGLIPKIKILLNKIGILKNVKNENTLLHINHITDSRDNNWSSILSDKQLEAIIKKYADWMKVNGYLDAT